MIFIRIRFYSNFLHLFEENRLENESPISVGLSNFGFEEDLDLDNSEIDSNPVASLVQHQTKMELLSPTTPEFQYLVAEVDRSKAGS